MAGILEEAGLEMGFEVVDADERLLMVIGQALGEGQADEERADEPGPLGHGVEVDRLEPDAGPRQRLADDGRDRLDVLARGELGDDPAVRRVDLVLGQDDVAEDLGRRKLGQGDMSLRHVSPIWPVGRAQHGRGRLVARRFDGQDQHSGSAFRRSSYQKRRRPSGTVRVQDGYMSRQRTGTRPDSVEGTCPLMLKFSHFSQRPGPVRRNYLEGRGNFFGSPAVLFIEALSARSGPKVAYFELKK